MTLNTSNEIVAFGITHADIATAARAETLDAAILPLMQKAGIPSADVAGIAFSMVDWSMLPLPRRVAAIRRWLELEDLYA